MIIFKDMKNCSVLWTRTKVDLFYVALGEKSRANRWELEGPTFQCSLRHRVQTQNHSARSGDRGYQLLEVMLWSLEAGNWKVWSFLLGTEVVEGIPARR